MVFGQAANAFACRSQTHWAFSHRLPSNRLIVQAVAIEFAALAAFLWVGPIARLLHQAPPPLAGWFVAALAMPAVIGIDALHKAVRARKARMAVPTGGAA